MERKELIGIVSLIICAIVLFCCSCTENKLKEAAEQANKNCPVSLGIVGEMTSITYESNTMEFLFTVDDQFTNIDALGANPEKMKSSLLAMVNNEKTKELIEMLIDADADLSIVYKGKTSGKEANITISSTELKEMMDSPAATNDEKLKLVIEQTNLQMPLDTGTGVIITELVDKGDVVVYMAKVTDKDQIKMISNNIENVKNSQKMMFKMMGPAEKMFFQMIIDANKKLGYTYYSDGTDETVDVEYTNEELKELFSE